MRCLDCSTVLDIDWLASVCLCSCGVAYATELLFEVDDEWWELIRTTRSFERDGNVLVVH